MPNLSKWLLIVGLIIIAIEIIGVGFYSSKKLTLIENEFKKEIKKVKEEMEQLEEKIEQLKKEAFPEKEKMSEIAISDWKTYKNEEYGFEIMYPGDWTVKYGDLSIILFPSTLKQHPFIGLYVKPNPQKLNIREFYNGINDRNLFQQSNNEYTIDQIAGKLYYKFIPSITFAGEVVIVVPLDSAFLEIVDSGNAFPEIINTMLSTLKFY
jgi:cell division protein FtsB